MRSLHYENRARHMTILLATLLVLLTIALVMAPWPATAKPKSTASPTPTAAPTPAATASPTLAPTATPQPTASPSAEPVVCTDAGGCPEPDPWPEECADVGPQDYHHPLYYQCYGF